MRKSIISLIAWMSFCSAASVLAKTNIELFEMEPDIYDQPSLQAGAQLYFNYCLGCHSLKYERYGRIAKDLGFDASSDLLEGFQQNLIFGGEKIGSRINIAMDSKDAKRWFGAMPPDLTNVARVRSTDWLYTYLLTFYVDPSRPTGVSNKVFENAMPNVLQELQGDQTDCKLVPERNIDGGELMADPLDRSKGRKMIKDCNLVSHVAGTGKLSPEKFQEAIYNLVNFLYYIGDPKRAERERLGGIVLGFLAFLFVPIYLLKREYWKGIH